MSIENYYLDLGKINIIKSDEEKKTIHRYYMDMITFATDRPVIAKSIFNTLYVAGYLKDIRQEKIENILNSEEQ